MIEPPTIIDCEYDFHASDYVMLSSLQNIDGIKGFSRSLTQIENHFSRINCGIVSCGGLCPGINNIIFNLVKTLEKYQVYQIWGFLNGFHGMVQDNKIMLNSFVVEDINNKGGSILNVSRGGLDIRLAEKVLLKYNIRQLYVIGGDGTLAACDKLIKYFRNNKTNIMVGLLPKTIDNDVGIIDQSFGFYTAVDEIYEVLKRATTEAKNNYPNCIMIVSVMGRHAGFLASYGTIAHGSVDLCLIPEDKIDWKHQMKHIFNVVNDKGYAVIVVAEGICDQLYGEVEQKNEGMDRKITSPAVKVKEIIVEYFSNIKKVMVKIIEPSYLIRSKQANARDAYDCKVLASGTVHGMMFGYTDFCTGMVNNHSCYIPIKYILQNSPRKLNINGRTYNRLIETTGQYSFV